MDETTPPPTPTPTPTPASPLLRQQLREAREAAKLSRAELAQRLGITETQVLRIENGTRSTSFKRAVQWMTACGFSMGSIHFGEEQRAALFATVLATLDEDGLDAVRLIAEAWPRLRKRDRTAILAIVAPDED